MYQHKLLPPRESLQGLLACQTMPEQRLAKGLIATEGGSRYHDQDAHRRPVASLRSTVSDGRVTDRESRSGSTRADGAGSRPARLPHPKQPGIQAHAA